MKQKPTMQIETERALLLWELDDDNLMSTIGHIWCSSWTHRTYNVRRLYTGSKLVATCLIDD